MIDPFRRSSLNVDWMAISDPPFNSFDLRDRLKRFDILLQRNGFMASAGSSGAGVITPFPLALVVCDNIYIDPYNGKRTIIGTFSAIGVQSFPLTLPILAVYIALTDGRGQINLRIDLVDVDEEKSLFSAESLVEFPDPRLVIEVSFAAQNIVFETAGEYRLRLFANNDFLMERRILVAHPDEMGAS